MYILIMKVNKLFFFFLSRCFVKEIENMFSVFLSRYRNTRGSFREREIFAVARVKLSAGDASAGSASR